jgi:chromosome segregation ATPase
MWSPTKADERLAHKSGALSSEREAGARAETSNASLRQHATASQAEIDRFQRGLAAVGGEISALQSELRAEPGDTKSLLSELQTAQEQRKELQADTTLSGAEMEHRLRSLRQDVGRLRERSKLLRETR